ncbi:MAG TPA: hypothetical protein RMI62_05730, partial [Polyangiaceae bacterium LLY-WYZ-15_(1-7)]|nr:hypothetical protein [Polyangiaceae bacterium LLY-WYZ-15_(1-7)]
QRFPSRKLVSNRTVSEKHKGSSRGELAIARHYTITHTREQFSNTRSSSLGVAIRHITLMG